jgi:hypothetical protein
MDPELEPIDRPTARDRVLATPELLEAILVHLPLCDILTRAQLVSAHFHDTISSSISIQQALFFLPNSNAWVSETNPLLSHLGVSFFIDQRSRYFMEQPDRRPNNFAWPQRNGLNPLVWQEYVRKNRVYSVKGASWRRMLVVQPPIKELELNGGNTLSNEQGVKMGQLENVFMDWGSFFIRKDGKGSLLARRRNR